MRAKAVATVPEIEIEDQGARPEDAAVIPVTAFPYLPIGADVRIGPFTLHPQSSIDLEDTRVNAETRQLAIAMREFHSDGVDDTAGAFVSTDRKGVVEIDEMSREALRLAVVAGCINKAPAMPVGDGGFGILTSDHATMFELHIDGIPRQAVGYDFGLIFNKRTIDGRDDAKVPAPVELHYPFVNPPSFFDHEFANSVYGLVGRDEGVGMAVLGALRWLDLAWRNSTSVGYESRVVFVRTGFEALLQIGDNFLRSVRAIDVILDDHPAKRTKTNVPSREGRDRLISLSDRERRYLAFIFHRNALIHADATHGLIQPGSDDVFFAAESWLRRAIRRAVVDPDWVARARRAGEDATAIIDDPEAE